jgi:hypothetical protein
MRILISDKRKIFSIQKEFSQMFPFLKLEFFAKSSKQGGMSSNRVVREPAKTLGECRTIHNSGSLTITPGMTVKDLEQNFRDIYGLTVQILRKSGKAWLGTTVTDGWSLKEQNEQGESLSSNVSLESVEKKTRRTLTHSVANSRKYFNN